MLIIVATVHASLYFIIVYCNLLLRSDISGECSCLSRSDVSCPEMIKMLLQIRQRVQLFLV